MKRRGFILLEALIYIVIVALVSWLVINLLLLMVRAFFDFRINKQLTVSGEAAMERLVREIRLADNIDPASILGLHPGRLLLTTTDELGQPTTVDFALAGDALTVKVGAAAAASTTGEGVTVSNLVFRSIATPVSKGVKVELTLADDRTDPPQEINFYGTAVLRGSY